MSQDARGLIDSPLPGVHRHANAPTAASFFVSSRLSLVAVDSFLKARQNDEATGYIAPIANIVIPNKGEYTFAAYFTLRRDG